MTDDNLLQQLLTGDDADAFTAALTSEQRAALIPQLERVLGGMDALEAKWQRFQAIHEGLKGQNDLPPLVDKLLAYMTESDSDTAAPPSCSVMTPNCSPMTHGTPLHNLTVTMMRLKSRSRRGRRSGGR